MRYLAVFIVGVSLGTCLSLGAQPIPPGTNQSYRDIQMNQFMQQQQQHNLLEQDTERNWHKPC